MEKRTDINIAEIKDIIEDVFSASLDAMHLKGFARKMLDNQLDAYLEDKDNDLDIEISFYKMLEIFKKRKIF